MNTFEPEMEVSVRYLGSAKATETVRVDPYWPKWDSPWWHMLLLYEMGEVKRVPEKIVREFVTSLNKIPLKIFPIQPGDMPPDVDPYRGSPCHCQLGNVYQVLATWGLDVDAELPWIRPWFLRYQMTDGGMNCDNDAYLVKDEVPSSMVGTIAAFESILLHTPRPWTSEEKIFLNNGSKFLIGRQLILGSETKHNAAERISAETWLKVCFPRFYLYDALRGLTALLHWADKTKQFLPPDAIRDVVVSFSKRFLNERVRNERQSFEGAGTISQAPSGDWGWTETATFFPLLTKVSAIGEDSPFLSRQWAETKMKISGYEQLKDLIE